jgi:quinol-cytochrome oxidoreductase complex cytochrome b subunit
LFLFNFIFLGFLGSQTAEHPTAIMGQICTGIHVCYVFVYIAVSTSFEETVAFEQCLKKKHI